MQRLDKEGIHGTKSRQHSNRMVPPDVHYMVGAKPFKEGPYPEPLSHVKARSNTSTVALQVIGGDKKGSLESGTVKYGCESHGTQIQVRASSN
jgi:hypothetical protein